MSKDSPIVSIRIPADLLADIQLVVAQTGTTRAEEPWNLTTWILQAIKGKLDHQDRARRQRERRRSRPGPGPSFSL